jgi:hypothetical protein
MEAGLGSNNHRVDKQAFIMNLQEKREGKGKKRRPNRLRWEDRIGFDN